MTIREKINGKKRGNKKIWARYIPTIKILI
jgi:hypothetical protein